MDVTGNAQFVHEPVLLEEVVAYLKPATEHGKAHECVMVDATTGEGGHAEAFLSRFPDVFLYCVDADETQLDRAKTRLRPYPGRVEFHNFWFSDFFSRYNAIAAEKPDRILFDLGISSRHYEESGRGFSLQKDEPLDMRLRADGRPTAREIVNNRREDELEYIFKEYGEERYARGIARSIVEARKKTPITTTGELEKVIWKAVPPAYRHRRIHPATRTFQALRIAVNGELEELKKGLENGFRVLTPGGRMGVISFHSLEDRIVKRFFKERNRTCSCPAEQPICQCKGEKELVLLTKKPVTAGTAEVKRNPRSRSAKFRVVEKV